MQGVDSTCALPQMLQTATGLEPTELDAVLHRPSLRSLLSVTDELVLLEQVPAEAKATEAKTETP